MLTIEQVRTLVGATVCDADGNELGPVAEVYLDDRTGRPEWWCTVMTGLFGVKESFVPLADADLRGDRLVVPYSKEQVKDAPTIDPECRHLSEQQEATLFRHYGLDDGLGVGADRREAGHTRLRRYMQTHTVQTAVSVSPTPRDELA